MRPPRNPFLLRAAEQIEDDSLFLSLCEPGLLELLPTDGLWDRRVVVRSSAGGGKTTLLRVFTPGPLRLLHARGGRDEQTAELYRQLAGRGVLTGTGPTVAAAMLSMAGKYTPLNDLTAITEGQRLRAFLALLNARILVAGLRAHLELAGLRYPDDLAEVSLGHGAGELSGPDLPADGTEIFRWARDIERMVARAMSSLGPLAEETLPGDDELSSLEILGRSTVLVRGEPSTAQTVVLLDDVHRLAPAQRTLLIDTLLARRAPVPVWVAERREGLTADELLSPGAKDERDRILIDIEHYWRGPRRQNFQRLVSGVADRRTMLAQDAPGSSFGAMLQGAGDAAWLPILGAIEERLMKAAKGRREFGSWIEAKVEPHLTPRERAIGMRSLEIRIERELAATQMSFDLLVRDEAALEELDRRREASNLREAAELFLCREFDLPYYYGSERLAQLAFANVDQFLDLASDLFEELSGAAILRQTPTLTVSRQQQIIEGAVRKLWSNLSTTVSQGTRVRSLLDGVGGYCAQRTYLPNAPYAPGVTGIGVRQSQVDHLEEMAALSPDSWQAQLRVLLAELIAHNFVAVQRSEAKGQHWSVYYLNRAWCVRYRLPLGFGGWQPVTADQLWSWAQGDGSRSAQRLVTA